MAKVNMKNEILAESFDNPISLPKHLLNALKTHKTSLGEHPSYPPEDEKTFDYKLTKKRFIELYNELSLIDDIDITNEQNLATILSELITQCQKIEEPIKEQLEVLCFNLVNSLFEIPEDTLDFSCKLVSSIDVSSQRLVPEETDEIEFDGIEEMEGLNDDVYKRRIINAIVQGASMYYSSRVEVYVSDIYKLNSKLPELYKKILILNNYLLFFNEDKMKVKQPTLAGNVNVHLGNDIIKTKIDAEAIIFPILLNESIKGFMELFSSHGLPNSMNKSNYVIKKSDFLLAEPWDMRLGYGLWELILNTIPTDDTTYIPLMFTEFVSLKAKIFHKLLREIFGKTKKGRTMMSALFKKVDLELQNDEFNDYVDNKSLDNLTITDDYFTPNELRGGVSNILTEYE